MATYQLTTLEKKSILECENWFNRAKNWHATFEILWRWGSVNVHTDDDTAPAIDLENDDGTDVYDLGYTVDVDQLDDGCGNEWKFSGNMSEEDREATESGYNEDWHVYMEENGWELESTELWFSGPLELKPVE